MKIAIICEAVFPENKGGLERWMVWLANNLMFKGFEVHYLNASGVSGVREGVIYKSITHEIWSYSKKDTRSISQSINFGMKLLIQLYKEDYDVIYCSQAPLVYLLLVKAAKFSRKKTLVIVEWLEIWSFSYWREYLGPSLGLFGFLTQFLALRIGDVNVCFTERVFKKLLRIGNNSKVYKLSGICMKNYSRSSLVPRRNYNIVFLSRFVKEKNPFLAIDAVLEYRSLGWTGKFFIIGSGPMETRIKRYIDSKGASNFIELLVNIPDIQVKEIMKSSFVLIHPSKREGYGLSMFEAACEGIPTILVNYPENASVDLAIMPELVCQEPSISELVSKLQHAFNDQEVNHERLKTWLDNVYPKMLGSESLVQIESIVKMNVTPHI